MSFEHPTPSGVVQLTKAARSWAVRFADKQRGRWRSPDAAAHAVASHQTGIPEWDERRESVSEDIIEACATVTAGAVMLRPRLPALAQLWQRGSASSHRD
jgi:hypothetical protein